MMEALQETSKEAVDIFVKANLRLSINIAKKKKSSLIDDEDVLQAALIILEHAVMKFDRSKGYKFSTYAIWWIRQKIDRELANNGRNIRLPDDAYQLVGQINKAISKLENTGQNVTSKSISEITEIPEDTIYELMQVASMDSLNRPVSNDPDSDELGSRVALDEDSIEDLISGVADSKLIAEAFASLGDDEQQVILLRFGLIDGVILGTQEIGLHLGHSTDLIGQLEGRAIRKLKNYIRINGLIYK